MKAKVKGERKGGKRRTTTRVGMDYKRKVVFILKYRGRKANSERRRGKTNQ